MSEPQLNEILQLGEADWADGVALARAVGWRDAAEDWLGLASVGTVLGLRDAGELVATGALCDLGSRLTVAKMLVHPSRQRQGLGQRLLLEVLRRAGARPVALVATPAGRPLYARHGFQTVERLRIHHGHVIFKAFGEAAPGMGMVGTLIGLVSMFAHMDDPKKIGPGMAIALLTTLYGAVLANVFALPIADKLANRAEADGRHRCE